MDKITELENRIKQLEQLVFKYNFSDLQVFIKKAKFNGGIQFRDGGYIYGGLASSEADIISEVGSNNNGSFYMSSGSGGSLWYLQSGTWTQLV